MTSSEAPPRLPNDVNVNIGGAVFYQKLEDSQHGGGTLWRTRRELELRGQLGGGVLWQIRGTGEHHVGLRGVVSNLAVDGKQ